MVMLALTTCLGMPTMSGMGHLCQNITDLTSWSPIQQDRKPIMLGAVHKDGKAVGDFGCPRKAKHTCKLRPSQAPRLRTTAGFMTARLTYKSVWCKH